MKTQFKSLSQFVAEIEGQEKRKEDFLVSNASMKYLDDDMIEIKGQGKFDINDYAHGQLAGKLEIPKKYYDKMGQIPGLRAANVNAWFDHNGIEKRTVRTLDNHVRAFLSDRFKPIDNQFVMSAFLPALKEAGLSKGNIEMQSSSMSESRMYLQMTFPSLTSIVKVGDVVKSGIVVRNSEVGAGAFDIETLIWRLVCSNGMIGTSLMRSYHVGKRIDEETMDVYRNDTLMAELNSLKLRLRDIIIAALKKENFEKQVGGLRKAIGDEIKKPVTVVENVTKKFMLSDEYSEFILSNMTKEGNMNRYGLANGITALAHEIEDPDKAYEIEKVGNDIIELSKSQWEALTAA